MTEALYILISAILFRIPRGGPGRETWRDLFNWSGPGSFGGALIWALGSSAGLYLVSDISLTAMSIIAIFLMLGEAPGWSRYWPNNTTHYPDCWTRLGLLSLRGCLMLNPLMGIIYFGCYLHRDKLPNAPVILNGWTAWAELMCGIVTASSYLILTAWVLPVLPLPF